jgi:endonuclease/exonuclease/phosphatase (EEP) superfamily protein YafD
MAGQQAKRANVVRVLSWNILATNEDMDELESVIRAADPDVLILIEVRPNLLEQIPFIERTYPNSHVITHWGGMGLGIFCKESNITFSEERFAVKVMPSIVARLVSADGSRKVDLVAMHTFSPTPPARALVRDNQIAEFIAWSIDRDVPLCLAGDLNTTPWTSSFLRLVRSGLHDSRRGTGNQASWPAFLGDLGIPIDHVLTRGECSVTGRKVIAGSTSSDHRPVQFDLSF